MNKNISKKRKNKKTNQPIWFIHLWDWNCLSQVTSYDEENFFSIFFFLCCNCKFKWSEVDKMKMNVKEHRAFCKVWKRHFFYLLSFPYCFSLSTKKKHGNMQRKSRSCEIMYLVSVVDIILPFGCLPVKCVSYVLW